MGFLNQFETSTKMLLLSLTGTCNLSCKYCYANEHAADFMSVETAIQAVDIAARSKEKFILQFSGGEPLLNFPVIQAVIEHVQENKIPALMQVQTNGTLITEKIAKILKKGKVAIGVSIDGRTQENDRQRCFPNGSGCMQAILNGIEILKHHSIQIGVTCVVTAQNVNKLTGIVELAYYLGNVRRIGFDLLRGQGRGAEIKAAEPQDVKAGLEKAFTLAEKLEELTGRKILFAQLERVEKLKKGSLTTFAHCHAMNGAAIYVDATGDIYACASLVGNPDFYIGNIKTGVDRQKQAKVAELIKNSLHFCLECNDFSLCGGGCFARWYGSKTKMAYPSECSLKRTAIHCS